MSFVTGSSSWAWGPASICALASLTVSLSVAGELIIGRLGFGESSSGAIADGWMNTRRRPGNQSPASTAIQQSFHV